MQEMFPLVLRAARGKSVNVYHTKDITRLIGMTANELEPIINAMHRPGLVKAQTNIMCPHCMQTFACYEIVLE